MNPTQRTFEVSCVEPSGSSRFHNSLVNIAALALVAAGLAGCGGGSTAAETAVATAAPTTSATTSDAAASAAAVLAAASAATSTATASSSDAFPTEGVSRALSAASSLSLAGVADAPRAAAVNSLATERTRKTFYVDSATGSDGNDGRAAAAGAAGTGPWRTLARLMTSGLAAGNAVQLACGSVWNETLRLPANGTATQPILVGPPSAGCTTAPAIDGSVTLAAAAWKPYRGNIYQATLASAPLQVLAGSGTFTEAHHPNRGYLTSEPGTPYLAMAAAGNSVTVNGTSVSTVLTTGPDLVLPAGANLAAGARVRVRTESYLIDESPVISFEGGKLTLSKPTTYTVRAGWGYFLIGQLWMLDSAGEWQYDAASRTLYAWMPDSAAPGATVNVSTLALGIDLQSRQYVVLNGLAVRRVGQGLDLQRSIGVQLRNSVVEDVVNYGVDASASNQAVFESNTFSRTGDDAITGQGEPIQYSLAMTVHNNVIRDSGVLMQGEQPISLPRRSLAAIVGGTGSTITGNTIVNSGYVGIQAWTSNVVEDNLIYGACSVQDDCGGIYTGGIGNNSQIRRNTIVHARGSLAGQPASQRSTAAQGIYIDDLGSGIVVEDNTVIETDNGIQLHNASGNTVRGNRLYANRKAQIWMQLDTARNPGGDMVGNVIEDNLIAAVYPQSVGLLFSTRYTSTAAFGSFDRNRYYDRATPTVVSTLTSSGQRAYSLAQWMGSTGAGSTQAVDVNGTGTSLHGYSGYTVSGSNLIANSALLTDTAGWIPWNATAPSGQLIREACPAGTCLRYVAGGSTGILSSPSFGVQKGQWYRLTLDLVAEQDIQAVPLVVRLGGLDYASLSDRDLSFTAGRTWGRYSMLFQATQTVNPLDPTGNRLGGRVDLAAIETGKSVSVANMELVAVTPNNLAQMSAALTNAGTKPLSAACPANVTQLGACSKFINLLNNQPVIWPLTVAPHSAVIIYAQEPTLLDSDGDGIPDGQDRCPGTAASAPVNASGCSFAQR